jgi:hypothetical protein
LQGGDEGLALIGFAIAPADQCGNKQGIHIALRTARLRTDMNVLR